MGGRGGASGLNAGKSQNTYWSEGVWSWSPARDGATFRTLPTGLQDTITIGLQDAFRAAKKDGSVYLKTGSNMGFTRVNASQQGKAVVFELKNRQKTLAKSSDAQVIAEAMADAFIRSQKKRK